MTTKEIKYCDICGDQLNERDPVWCQLVIPAIENIPKENHYLQFCNDCSYDFIHNFINVVRELRQKKNFKPFYLRGENENNKTKRK